MPDTDTKMKFSKRFWTCSSPGDDAAWQAMTRDEQLAALRDLAHHPDTGTQSDASIEDIRRAAHERCLARRQGQDG